MITTLAHIIRLNPTKAQTTFFKKACGCARVSYNYGLAKYKEQLNIGQKPKILEIKKVFNVEKKILFPWMSETNKDANQQPFTNLQTAFGRFFKKQGNFPKFKKKGIKDSFYISNDKFEVLTLSDREFVCENCGQVIDRDLNAALNIENFGLNKLLMEINSGYLRVASPEVTPVDKEALACSDTSETALDEAGIFNVVDPHLLT